MKFQVIKSSDSGNSYFLSFECGYKTYAMRLQNISVKGGGQLRVGRTYSVIATKIIKLGNPTNSLYLWSINDTREGYIRSFQDLVDSIAPGFLERPCFISKILVKEVTHES
jgi:hypothetical protein